MQEVPDLIACEECDAIHRRITLDGGEAAFCSRCGVELERDMSSYSGRVLPLTIAGLFMYIIANAFPIVEMELQGSVSQATLIDSVLSLNSGGMPLVAFLVLATTILFPLMQLLGLMYLSASVTRFGYHPGFNLLARMIQTLRPWMMLEVFLLAAIVAFVKLTSMATILPGVALWAFGALVILLASMFSFNPRYIWQMTLPEKGEKKYAGR